jgi:ligand-binding sensor domain-containing protein
MKAYPLIQKSIALALNMFILVVMFSPAQAAQAEDARWSAIGLSDTVVEALVVDPAAPNILYAGTQDGVFKSTDGGTEWSPVNAGLPGSQIYPLVINPAVPGTLYVGVTSYGVYKTVNGGIVGMKPMPASPIRLPAFWRLTP